MLSGIPGKRSSGLLQRKGVMTCGVKAYLKEREVLRKIRSLEDNCQQVFNKFKKSLLILYTGNVIEVLYFVKIEIGTPLVVPTCLQVYFNLI